MLIGCRPELYKPGHLVYGELLLARNVLHLHAAFSGRVTVHDHCTAEHLYTSAAVVYMPSVSSARRAWLDPPCKTCQIILFAASLRLLSLGYAAQSEAKN